MAENYVVNGDDLTSIADAIRTKTGETEGMSVEEMPAKIMSLSNDEDINNAVSAHNTDTGAHPDIREAITSYGPNYDEWDAALGDVYMDMSNKMPRDGGNFTGTVQAGDSYQTPGTSCLRNSKLVSTDTTPTVNGEINWTYG